MARGYGTLECAPFIAAEAAVEVLVAARAFGRAVCGGAVLADLSAASSVKVTTSLMPRRRSAPCQSGDKSRALHTQALRSHSIYK